MRRGWAGTVRLWAAGISRRPIAGGPGDRPAGARVCSRRGPGRSVRPLLRRKCRARHHCARARALFEWLVGTGIEHIGAGEVAIETSGRLYRGKSCGGHRPGRDGRGGGAFADAFCGAIPCCHGDAATRVLLRRRIERAQHMLTISTSSLVAIAFEVGFKSQSHFTTVFARFVGETPKGWRQRTMLVPSHGCSRYSPEPGCQLGTSERTRRIGTALDEGVKLRGSWAYSGTSELVSG